LLPSAPTGSVSPPEPPAATDEDRGMIRMGACPPGGGDKGLVFCLKKCQAKGYNGALCDNVGHCFCLH
ncbi:hypothetical protein BAE44_0016442, partial [Dichanthelium oligosanthes]